MSETRDIVLPYQWSARPYQKPLWDYLIRGGKRAVCCWHRRSGKDEVALHFLACSAHQRVGNFWYMLPQYGQARKAMWEAINPHSGKRRIDEAFPQEIRRTTREQEMLIVFRNGSTFQLVGSDNFNSLVGSPPVGLVFSEYALSDPSAWGYLRPILLENGGWAIFNSTPRGRNHFHALLTFADTEAAWFAQRLSADETACFTQEALVSELREMQAEQGVDYGYALWLQEYYCSFDAAIPGSIWGDCVKAAEDSGRVVDYDIDPALPVFTGWDLGRTDDTSIWWFQFNGQGIDVFDHHSSSLKDMPFYFALLEEKRIHHGITYALHHYPHDARPRTLAAGGKSIYQQSLDAANVNRHLGTFTIGKRLDKQEHIQAARATFPFCRFHKTRTEKGVNSLRQYHREWDAEKKIFRDTPDHDWCLAGETPILTPTGWKPIQTLSVHDIVLTPSGQRGILRTGIVRWTNEWTEVRGVQCTKEHRFFTSRGLVEAGDVCPKDALWTRDSWGLRCLAFWSATWPFGFTDAIISATREAQGMQIGQPCSFIAWCMRLSMAQFRRCMKSTTLTGTPSTITQAICPPSFGSLIAANISQLLGISADVSSAGNFSAIIRSGPPPAPFRVNVPNMPPLNESAAPAYNLTVDHDHCYFVQGADGRAYLVANSSHDSDAFMELSTSWRRPKPGAKPDAPLEDRLLAGNPILQTMGQMRDAHLSKRKRERQYNWVT